MSARADIEAALAVMPEAAILTDQSQHILYLNPACERLLGRPLRELSGSALASLLGDRALQTTPSSATAEGALDTRARLATSRTATGERVPGREIELRLTKLPSALMLATLRPVQRSATSEPLAPAEHARASARELETQLAHERARLRTYLTLAPAAIAIHRGPEHVIELVSDTYVQLAGRDDLIGKRFVDAFPELAAQGYVATLDRVYRTGEPARSEEAAVDMRHNPRRAGEQAFFHSVVLPTRNEHGEIDGLFVHSTEVTTQVVARRQAVTLAAQVAQAVRDRERSLALLNAVIDQMPAAMIVADPAGRLLFGNARMETVFRSPFTASGSIARFRDWKGYHHDGRRIAPNEWPLARALLHGETILDLEIEVERGDGTRGAVVTSASPVRSADGELIAGVVAFYDVTDRKQMEAALQRQSHVTRTITENASLGLLMMDARQHCTYMNAAAEAITGYTLREVQDRPLHDFVHHTRPDGRPYPIHECPIDRALPTEARQRGEEVFVHKDGRFYHVAFTASPIIEHGSPVGTIIEIKDVSEEKRARAAQERAEKEQRLLAAASELLLGSLELSTTLGTVARLAVPALCDACAIDLVDVDADTDEPVLNEVALTHVDPERAALVRELRQRMAPNEHHGVGKVLRTGRAELLSEIDDTILAGQAPDPALRALFERVRPRSILFAPLKTRGRVLGVLTLASLTRALDVADLAFATELAHRIALAVENASLYRQAQRAIQLRDEFLLIASHELRTPLTPLQLQLQHLERTLESTGGTLPPARMRATFQRARRQVERLTSLVENLLDVSRIQMGRLVLHAEEVDLAELVRDVVGRFSEDAARIGSTVELRCMGAPVGLWDRLRIEQVVVNLLSNALKYGSAQPVTLEVDQRDERGILRVIDHGIGVPPDQLQRIFGRFERAVSSREYGGLGLGLYIVHQIVGAHGGTVAAESAAGAGATFVVELPLRPAATCDAEPPPQPRAPASPTI